MCSIKMLLQSQWTNKYNRAYNFLLNFESSHLYDLPLEWIKNYILDLAPELHLGIDWSIWNVHVALNYLKVVPKTSAIKSTRQL